MEMRFLILKQPSPLGRPEDEDVKTVCVKRLKDPEGAAPGTTFDPNGFIALITVQVPVHCQEVCQLIMSFEDLFRLHFGCPLEDAVASVLNTASGERTHSAWIIIREGKDSTTAEWSFTKPDTQTRDRTRVLQFGYQTGFHAMLENLKHAKDLILHLITETSRLSL